MSVLADLEKPTTNPSRPGTHVGRHPLANSHDSPVVIPIIPPRNGKRAAPLAEPAARAVRVGDAHSALGKRAGLAVDGEGEVHCFFVGFVYCFWGGQG